MFHDQWQMEKNERRIYPPSPLPWNRHSKVRGIFVSKRLQKVFFCYGKQTISSLLQLSSLFQKEHTTSVGKYVHQFPFSFISCLPLRFFLFLVDWYDCRYRKRRQKNLMQVWPIFWSYLDRLIQRYSSLNYRYTARDQIRGLRIIWTFC